MAVKVALADMNAAIRKGFGMRMLWPATNISLSCVEGQNSICVWWPRQASKKAASWDAGGAVLSNITWWRGAHESINSPTRLDLASDYHLGTRFR